MMSADEMTNQIMESIQYCIVPSELDYVIAVIKNNIESHIKLDAQKREEYKNSYHGSFQ